MLLHGTGNNGDIPGEVVFGVPIEVAIFEPSPKRNKRLEAFQMSGRMIVIPGEELDRSKHDSSQSMKPVDKHPLLSSISLYGSLCPRWRCPPPSRVFDVASRERSIVDKRIAGRQVRERSLQRDWNIWPSRGGVLRKAYQTVVPLETGCSSANFRTRQCRVRH